MIISLGIYSVQDNDIVPVELAVVGKEPLVLYDGNVYRHDATGWKKLDYEKKIKQIFTDESYLCVLDVAGKLHCDEFSDYHEIMGNSAIVYYLANEALDINKEESFVLAADHVTNGVTALLEDGSLLVPMIGEHQKFALDITEEILMMSGSYILTESGNVYRISVDDMIDFGVEVEQVYDEADIVYISGDIAITKEGKAMAFGDKRVPDVSEWKDLVQVTRGFNYAVGLTSKGKVFFAHADKEKSTEIEAEFKSWHDIIGIEAYFSSVYGVDKNGEVFVVDFSDR